MFSGWGFAIIQRDDSPHMSNHDQANRIHTQTSDLPIAHIEAQDVSLSLPIREYLELNGCAVVQNRNPSIAPTYHIVIGDDEFVKDTIANQSKKSIETFAIILRKKNTHIIFDEHQIHAKIAVVLASTISTREAERIFAYFFTGGKSPYSPEGSLTPIAREPITIPTMHHHAAPNTPKHAGEDHTHRVAHIHDGADVDDTGRIARTINDLFGKSSGGTEENVRHDQKRIHDDPKPPIVSLPVPAVPGRMIVSTTVIIISALLLPIAWYLLAIGLVGLSQAQVFQSLKNGNNTDFAKAASNTSYWALQGQRTLRFMGAAAGSIGAVDLLRNQERMMSVAAGLGEVETRAAGLMDESVTLLPTFFRAENDPGKESLLVAVERMRRNLEDLSNALGLVSAQLEVLGAIHTFPFQFFSGQQLISVAQSYASRAIVQVSHARNLLSLYRVGGGFDGKKTYLITLQNSMELRPTGGFIGSLALVNIENGIMDPPQIQDVYVVDGQLKGHVDPPTPIKELLEQEHWYLRDSNWNPDFTISGEKAAWFYEKETGLKVDGVIAVSTPLLTELLGAIGPIELPDYNDRISKDNFFGKSLFYTKADFFPGSTQKKDFLGSLGTAILGRLTTAKAKEGHAVFQAIGTALSAGDVQFWFPGQKIQGIVQQAGWAGRLAYDSPCQIADHPCLIDRIAVVDANMGVNKVNAYIKRIMKSRVDIDEQGVIDGSVTMTYENTSTNDAAETGGGVYLSYSRTFFPEDTLIVSVTADGQEILMKPVPSSKRIYPYRDADTPLDSQPVVAVALTVPPMTSRTITIRYQMGAPLVFADNSVVFVHVLRKQPGVSNTNVDVAIGYPAGWKAFTDKSIGAEKDNGFLANAKEVRYNTTLDQTKDVTITFTK